MRRSALLVLCALALFAGASAPRPTPVEACATVSASPQPIEIAGEEALILWQPETGTEHFIRRAGFAGASRDFGFLVPTPTQPELGEVPAGIFGRLFDVYKRPPPRRRVRSRERGALASTASREVQSPWVDVVEQRTVAGLDTAVLRASDGAALNGWLSQHGYPSSEPLQRWIAPYVAEGWYVTAFRYDPGSGGTIASQAVRMSFATERPFYPYSEPPSRAPARPLRVSLVAPTRMQGRVGRRRWRARVGYADTPGADRLRRALDGAVPALHVDDDTWLTVFDEPRSRRGDADLYFDPAPQQRAVAPTLTERIVLAHPLAPDAPAPRPRRRGTAEVEDPFAR